MHWNDNGMDSVRGLEGLSAAALASSSRSSSSSWILANTGRRLSGLTAVPRSEQRRRHAVTVLDAQRRLKRKYWQQQKRRRKQQQQSQQQQQQNADDAAAEAASAAGAIAPALCEISRGSSRAMRARAAEVGRSDAVAGYRPASVMEKFRGGLASMMSASSSSLVGDHENWYPGFGIA